MKNKTYYCFLLLLGFMTVFSNACKKDEEKDPSVVTDIDGNVYQTITIANQTWMTDNLKTTKYNDGTAIPFVADSALWRNLSGPGYCWYENDPGSYKSKYGALYNWFTINTGKLCPKGWHIPSDAEWTSLINLSLAAGYMVESGTYRWTITGAGAAIESGFNDPPAGFRYFNGGFSSASSGGFWFSSTLETNGLPIGFTLSSDNHYISMKAVGGRTNGISVRCIKD
jgi:uncharacterized protein (TIGR02145 family)